MLDSLKTGDREDLFNTIEATLKQYIPEIEKLSFIPGQTVKQFFDLRCMRRCTLGPFDQYDMLKFYLRDEYSMTWKYALSFWIHGGFNPFKWFRKPKRGQ